MNNVDTVLKQFGDQVTRLAKINIGKSRTVKGKRRVTDNSGALRKSIDYKIVDDGMVFEMEDYGDLVDSGQLGSKKKILKDWNKSIFTRGKGYTNRYPDIGEIKKWVKSKPVRLRDLKTNSFTTVTEKKRDAQVFLIARKIKEEGIQPTLFISEPFTKEYKDLPDKVLEAFDEDLNELI